MNIRATFTLIFLAGSCVGAGAAEDGNQRRPANDAELKYWLENMVWNHGFSKGEVAEATGLTSEEVEAAIKKFGVTAERRPRRKEGEPLRVVPYPGGRHPR